MNPNVKRLPSFPVLLPPLSERRLSRVCTLVSCGHACTCRSCTAYSQCGRRFFARRIVTYGHVYVSICVRDTSRYIFRRSWGNLEGLFVVVRPQENAAKRRPSSLFTASSFSGPGSSVLLAASRSMPEFPENSLGSTAS